MKLTVYHDGQFWVGVIEDESQGKLRAARFIFGSEPKDEEILAFVRNGMVELVSRLTQEVVRKVTERKKGSPKRLAREAGLELSKRGPSTFAQAVLQLELEKRKVERKIVTKQQKEETKMRMRELKEKKAKEKHRGH